MKDVIGYEGYYGVTSCGKIWSYRAKKFMKLQVNKKGYVCVNLKLNGQQSNQLIHRLVALAYLPNPRKLPEINHKDENKLNNSVNNLEWCDRKYNINYGTGMERSTETQRKTSKLNKRVLCVETGIIYFSAQEAKRQTGIDNGSISRVCNGKQNVAGGYHWKYIE